MKPDRYEGFDMKLEELETLSALFHAHQISRCQHEDPVADGESCKARQHPELHLPLLIYVIEIKQSEEPDPAERIFISVPGKKPQKEEERREPASIARFPIRHVMPDVRQQPRQKENHRPEIIARAIQPDEDAAKIRLKRPEKEACDKDALCRKLHRDLSAPCRPLHEEDEERHSERDDHIEDASRHPKEEHRHRLRDDASAPRQENTTTPTRQYPKILRCAARPLTAARTSSVLPT